MNLAIDIGNTRVKLASFEADQLVQKWNWPELEMKQFAEVFENQKFDYIVLSTVRDLGKDFDLSDYGKLIVLDHETLIPIKNLYKTPKTLGKDRLAAIIGAWSLFENQASLVIDSGTCVTYDFINKDGDYLGGNIAPGVELRYRAMDEFTANLPLVSRKETNSLLGYDTESALVNGGLLGVIFEIDTYVRRLESIYGNINVIITGGDAEAFGDKLEKQIFVSPNLVLIGLNEIAKHDAKQL